MKKNLLSFIVLLMFFQSCSVEKSITPKDNKIFSLPIFNENVKNDYLVSVDVLKEYLSVTKKLQNVDSIIPLVSENDTLVYFVKYKKGWDVIPADIRVESVLASSNNDQGIIIEDDYLRNKFIGILEHMKLVKNNDDAPVSRLWSYLQLRVLSRSCISTESTKSPRGVVSGMWVEVLEEPQYEVEEYVGPHIVTTSWTQDSIWNQSMPTGYRTAQGHYLVGCGPIAVGQIIYHYRKNNSRNIAIPQTANLSLETEEFPEFLNFSSAQWGALALNAGYNHTMINNTSVFLSYLAQQMDVQLTQDGTLTVVDNLGFALDSYGLQFNTSNSYVCDEIIQNLYNRQPVVVVSEWYRGDVRLLNHAYIIDRYRAHNIMCTTTYRWIRNCQPTDWELQTLPQWRFDETLADGNETIDITISNVEDTYIGMNWGSSNTFDDFYLVKSYASESEDEAGIVPSIEIIYEPIWSIETYIYGNDLCAKNIHKVIYDIREKN